MLRAFGRIIFTALALLLVGRAFQSIFYVEAARAVARTKASSDTTLPASVKELLQQPVLPAIIDRVSFPLISYPDAFPGTAETQELEIRSFGEEPGLSERLGLPPVAERLPLNPAVVRGPEGIGRYGGIWRQCTASAWHIPTKVCYESLVRLDSTGKIQPGLAYRWEVSADCKVYTFFLRKGHRHSDGTPFTSADITWNCNVQIGSPAWGPPPSWMQPTDGTMLLYPEDFFDWRKFAERVCVAGPADARSPAATIWKNANEELRALLQSMLADTPTQQEASRATELLNDILQQCKFFNLEALAGVNLSGNIESLETRGISLLSAEALSCLNLLQLRNDLCRRAAAGLEDFSAVELRQLNVLTFRAAFGDAVAAPQRTRARVECVPDESGDDSHIIRFIFRRPNPLLLEMAATFMFYRGLFESSRYMAALHRDGAHLLTADDILDPRGLARMIVEYGAAQRGSREDRLWPLLSKEGALLFRRVASAETLTNSDAAEMARQINLALRSAGYFEPALWSDFNFNAELSALVAKGYSKLSEAERFRWNELLLRADWLERVRRLGSGDLNTEELQRFNIAIFRVTYGEHVSANREAALNHAARLAAPSCDSWIARLRNRARYHPVYNPHVPVLTAWRLVSEPSEHVQRFIRNPYYYKVDTAGNQLPYLDEIQCEIESQKSIRILKLRSGNVSFQTRDLDFSDFSVLKQNETRGGYEMRLWPNDYCGELTFYCLQAHANLEYARLQADSRFRRALSLALNRQEIIDIVFKGMGTPAQYSVPSESPFYSAKLATAAVSYEPAEANRLLDEIGLSQRASDGTRLFWDGKTPVVMDVTTTAERPLEAVQLACRYWQNIGINAQMKVQSQTTINRLISAGTLDIGVHKEGGNFFGPLMAGGFAPSHPGESPQWGVWAEWIGSHGASGVEPPRNVKELARMWDEVLFAPSREEMHAAWQRLADRVADQLPIIGIMTSPGQPVYVKRGFRNVPKLAFSGWIAHQPGNSFPEAFFWDEGAE